jgi:hypothetical protein
MNDPTTGRRRTRKDLAFQIVGFLAGVALLAWCIERAFSGDGAAETWERLRTAPGWARWGLVLTSLGSLLVNSLMFWSLVQPIRRVGLAEMTGVNLVASMLNYLPMPLRIGMIARIAYHVRVNGMGAIAVAGYFAAVILVTLLVGGALAVTVVAFPFLGATLAAIAGLAALAVGLLLVSVAARWPPLARFTRDAERVLADRRALATGIAMRTADALLWSTRMVCAVATLGPALGIELSLGESAVLGLVAVAMSMNPLGRFGFREAGVVWVSGFLFAGRMDADELERAFARLAIVESAAEGAVTLPLGAVLVPWFLGKMRKARRDDGSPRPADDAPQAVVERQPTQP